MDLILIEKKWIINIELWYNNIIIMFEKKLYCDIENWIVQKNNIYFLINKLLIKYFILIYFY